MIELINMIGQFNTAENSRLRGNMKKFVKGLRL